MAEQVQVIDRVFDILEYMSLAEGKHGPTQIAAAVGLSKSTVHRLLASMHQRGYVDRDDTDGTYSIGIKLVEMV